MKFPAINKQERRGINIPEFTGGLNLREGPTHCNDNQLTDVVNMWYKDGALRTRPGMKISDMRKIKGTESYSTGSCMAEDMQCHEIYEEIFNTTTGKESRFQLCSLLTCYSDKSYINFYWCGAGEIIELPQLILSGKAVISYFVVKYDDWLYCFVNTNGNDGYNGEIYKLRIGINGLIISDYSKPPLINWGKLGEEDIYAPLVAYHCKTDGSYGMNYDQIMASGTMLEGFNILTDRYRICYSAYNAAIAEEAVIGEIKTVAHLMRYSLLDSVRAGDTVTAKYTINGQTYNHSVTLTKTSKDGWYWEDTKKDDGLFMCVVNNLVIFVSSEPDENGNSPTSLVTADGQTEDNLEITAPFHATKGEKQKIFGMRRAVWFGGGSEGLAGGTRLFLCGNIGNEKSLVCWSGLNNPLYFPENSYFYVGDESSEVTGFGKQSDMLIIFKSHETWFTRYNLNTSISSDDLTSQNVIDLQSSAVYFPLTCINPNIGCSYPETVQLCRNRLVWLGDDKQVYTLVTNNQYNERSIFAVSEMVNPNLKKVAFSNATACDWNGYYCLSFENKLYLMDYNSYGYIYVSSHGKTEDANLRIPWYYWELPKPEDMSIIHATNNKLCFMCCKREIKLYSDKLYSYVLDLDLQEQTDGGAPIKSIVQTKLFDFGFQNHFKNISSVGLSLGYNGGEEITVTYLTENGEAQDVIILEDGADERSAEFIKSVILSPCIYSSVRFGVRLEAEGNIIIDGMNLDYRILGRSR